MSRLFGLETEYAIRFTPRDGFVRPSNKTIYEAMQEGISSCVDCQVSERNNFQEQFFVENGGSFNYEFLPQAPEGGLLEGATPECHSPEELVLYQRAQERILITAIPFAEEYLRDLGYEGTIGLLKNCRDSEGHIYGAQENYEANISSGWKLSLYKVGVAVLTFPFIVYFGLFLLSVLALGISLLLVTLGVLAVYYMVLAVFNTLSKIAPVMDSLAESYERLGHGIWRRMEKYFQSDSFEHLAMKAEIWIQYPMMSVTLAPYILWQRLFAFRQQRRAMEGFMLSRIIFTGAGSIVDKESFVLSEKISAAKRTFRSTLGHKQRALFDNGNLLKEVMLATIRLYLMNLHRYKQLFAPRQRMQIGLSDSNRAHVSEYLKIATSLLVLDMAESGFLKDYPKVKNPIQSLRQINSDPTLKATVKVHGMGEMTALDLQNWYLERAREYIRDRKDVQIEYIEIIRLWDEVLKLLESDPGQLIGRIDWVTKRYLIETAGKGGSKEMRKKIDLGYHELDKGYYDYLEREGLTVSLVQENEILKAMKEPSSPERVRLRSRYIRGMAYSGDRVKISWSSVQIGRGRDRKIIDLNKIKKN